VSRCIDPRPGWQVLVTGTSVARPLLERLSASLARRDAYAIRRISFDEPFGIDSAWVNAAPAALAPTLAPLERELVNHVDGKIFVLAPESEYPLAHLSSEAVAAVEAQVALVRPRERLLAMPNVLCCFPTAGLASLADLDLSAFSGIVYESCLRDWERETAFMRHLAKRLDDAERVLVRAPGTELAFSIGGRKALVDDGRVNMPGGEVFISPEESSAQGMISFTEFPQTTPAGPVVGATLVFEDGVVIEAMAEEGHDILAAQLGRDEGARRIGEFGIGCNGGIPRPLANRLFDEKIAGTIHIALGQGFPESGGSNKSLIHWDLIKDLRPGGEIELDGKIAQREGRWLI
jgi:aminopeptidase